LGRNFRRKEPTADALPNAGQACVKNPLVRLSALLAELTGSLHAKAEIIRAPSRVNLADLIHRRREGEPSDRVL